MDSLVGWIMRKTDSPVLPKEKLCSIFDCDMPQFSKGICHRHFNLARKGKKLEHRQFQFLVEPPSTPENDGSA